jgi:NADP-dependent 3-hydroxy acid dehydrogenase YdfG
VSHRTLRRSHSAPPFWDHPSRFEAPLTADDVAEAVMFAVTRPPHVDVNEILIRPTSRSV